MSTAYDTDQRAFDDGLYQTVWGVKLLTLRDLVKRKRRKKKKRNKRGKRK